MNVMFWDSLNIGVNVYDFVFDKNRLTCPIAKTITHVYMYITSMFNGEYLGTAENTITPHAQYAVIRKTIQDSTFWGKKVLNIQKLIFFFTKLLCISF